MKQMSSFSYAPACDTKTPWYRKPIWLAAVAIVVLGVVLLASGPIGRLAQLWPLLFVLACPLMHVFMCRRQQDSGSAPTAPVDSGRS